MAERKLADLKKEYEKAQEKYKLPSFQALNEDFEIEKAVEHESEILLREIRKVMMDKVIAYFRFIELLLNPSNAPMFFLFLLKGLEATDRKNIEDIYNKLGKIEIDVLSLDNNYSEKSEAEFIKKMYKEWQEVKKDMQKLVDVFSKSWDRKSEKKEKGYLG